MNGSRKIFMSRAQLDDWLASDLRASLAKLTSELPLATQQLSDLEIWGTSIHHIDQDGKVTRIDPADYFAEPADLTQQELDPSNKTA